MKSAMHGSFLWYMERRHVFRSKQILFFSQSFPFQGEELCDCLLPWAEKPLNKGSTLQGKNLLLEEQILSFKS